MRRRVWWVVGAVLLAALAGCSTEQESEYRPAGPTQAPPAEPQGGPISDGVVPKEPQTPVELPSTAYGAGDLESRATLETQLALRSDGCVVGAAAPDQAEDAGVALLWPAGWTAQLGADGRVEILDPTGTAVLHEGDHVEVAGGTYEGKSTWQCRESSQKTFAMDGTPRRVG